MSGRGSLIRADSAYKICKKAWASFQAGRYSEAEARFRAALLIESEHADALYGLGVTLNILGHTGEAISCLQGVARIDPSYGLAYGVLGDISLAQGDEVAAFEYFAQGAAVDPDNHYYKTRLVDLGKSLSFSRINPTLKHVLLSCLQTPGLDFEGFGNAWMSILESDPAFADMYRISRQKDYSSFLSVFERTGGVSALTDPFFLAGLGKFIVPDTAFERFCTYVRRYLLEAFVQGGGESFDDNAGFIAVASSLSRYCSMGGYILHDTQEERGRVKKIKSGIEKKKPEDVSLAELAVLGCYIPLYHLKKCRKIAEILPGGDSVSLNLKTQIEDFLAVEKMRRKVSALTPIVNEDSQSVQLQFEEFAYPLWKGVPGVYAAHEVEADVLGREGARVMVAGCGTGREALDIAHTYPGAHVLGLDLSRLCLAYAFFKRDEAGIENVRFKQGDILELSGRKERFDYIICPDALCYLRDPGAGIKALSGLLAPGGLMRLGLPSGCSDPSLDEVCNRLEDGVVGSDAFSIREIRADMRGYAGVSALKDIEKMSAYYAMSSCRDLLFRPQTTRFDVPRIIESLSENGLAFVKFCSFSESVEDYPRRFQDDPSGRNLEYWGRWEKTRPETFRDIYRFWCRKDS